MKSLLNSPQHDHILRTVLKNVCVKHGISPSMVQVTAHDGPAGTFYCVSHGVKEAFVKDVGELDTFNEIVKAFEALVWKPRPLVKRSERPAFKARRAPIKRFWI